jgi:hypothetical protein
MTFSKAWGHWEVHIRQIADGQQLIRVSGLAPGREALTSRLQSVRIFRAMESS